MLTFVAVQQLLHVRFDAENEFPVEQQQQGWQSI